MKKGDLFCEKVNDTWRSCRYYIVCARKGDIVYSNRISFGVIDNSKTYVHNMNVITPVTYVHAFVKMDTIKALLSQYPPQRIIRPEEKWKSLKKKMFGEFGFVVKLTCQGKHVFISAATISNCVKIINKDTWPEKQFSVALNDVTLLY